MFFLYELLRRLFHIGNFCFWVSLLGNCAVDFVEICNVYVGKIIIKAAKRIFNSDKICRSYSELKFGVTLLEHSVCWIAQHHNRHTRLCRRLILKSPLRYFSHPSPDFWNGVKKCKLENMAIANALQLEATRRGDATPVLFRFNYDTVPSLKSLNLSIVVL